MRLTRQGLHRDRAAAGRCGDLFFLICPVDGYRRLHERASDIVLFVELGIKSIEVAAVKLILYDTQAFAEPLVVYDLALP